MTINIKDAAAGAIFIAIGLIFGLSAHVELPMGSALRMGPGYFPTLLAGILIALGAFIVIRAIGQAPQPVGAVPWRGLALILVAPIVFGLTIFSLGFVPAVTLVALVSSFASRRVALWQSLLISAGITLFCVAVFYYGLGLPVRPFAAWLD